MKIVKAIYKALNSSLTISARWLVYAYISRSIFAFFFDVVKMKTL